MNLYTSLDNTILHQALVVNENETRSILEMLVRSKCQTTDFNWVERSTALEHMIRQDMGDRVDLIKLMGIHPASERIQLYLRLAGAPEGVKRPVAEGRLHTSTVFEIFKFEEEEHQNLAGFISELSLGTRKRNQLISMVREICMRDGISPSTLLYENPEVLDILSSPMDYSHRSARLFSWVESQRYPIITGYRRRFLRLMGETGITRYGTLTLPRDFERWDFTLQVKFSSREELQSKLAELVKIAGGEQFKLLMALRSTSGSTD